MKYPEPPSLSMKVVIVMWVMLALVILLILASCSSFQKSDTSKLEPVIENKIREINSSKTMTVQEKESTISIIESLKNENRSLREVIAERDKAVKRQSELITECQEELKDVTENAGKYEGIRNFVTWIFGAIIIWLLLKVFKEKIPFNIPFV